MAADAIGVVKLESRVPNSVSEIDSFPILS